MGQPDVLVTLTLFLLILMALLELHSITRRRGGRKGPRPTG
jgi:hypothetical protein